jgi:putative Mg2+ transporter-C (MgtC) family protein
MRGMSGSLQLAVFGRIAFAAALGFVIGLERELRGSPAGERTIALVAAGAAVFASIAVEIFPDTGGQVLAGVATGIGFLGAGLIWRMGAGPARGLTTAAGAWTVAAMGLLAGARLYLTAGLIALLTLLILEFEYFPFLGRLVHRTGPPTGPDGQPGSEPGA